MRLRVIAGSAYGATSPARVFSPLFYVEARLERGAALELPAEHAERAAYVVGRPRLAATATTRMRAATCSCFARATAARLRAQEPSRVALVGGAPLDGERHIWWNFVSSSPQRIERARDDWRSGRFPKVPGDELEFIPLPDA